MALNDEPSGILFRICCTNKIVKDDLLEFKHIIITADCSEK